MFRDSYLYLRIVTYILAALGGEGRRYYQRTVDRLSSSKTPVERTKNIIVVGANFAGIHAIKELCRALPASSPYRIVVIEPNTHFNFTWVFPRFCVVKGHEHKAFIPHTGYIAGAPEGSVRWIQDWVVQVEQQSVKIQSGEEIPYDFLIMATGSGVKGGLPSRTNETEKIDAIKRLREMQNGIEKANKIVVVGGGAAGVEVATDAKSLYKNKTVVLVHSRSAPMHRFGPRLQASSKEGLEKLGVEVILDERVVNEDPIAGTVTLRSGRVIECDYYINCTGQTPNSGLIASLSPASISEDGHIKVLPTLQIADPSLPNVYACGDVADTHTANPNARAAIRQASVVVDNVLQGTRGKKPGYTYGNNWGDGMIKLTLGLGDSVTWLGDGDGELLFPSKDKDEALWCDVCWSRLGVKPFEDPYMEKYEESIKS